MKCFNIYDGTLGLYRCMLVPTRKHRKFVQRTCKQFYELRMDSARMQVYVNSAYGREHGAQVLRKLKRGCKLRKFYIKTMPMLSSRLDRKIADIQHRMSLSLQNKMLDAHLNANGAYDLSWLQPGLEWYDLYVDDAPITDSVREQSAIEAGCNEKVLKWARVPMTDEDVFASYPPMAVFEFAASPICGGSIAPPA